MAALALSEDFTAKLKKALDDKENEHKHANYKAAVDHAKEMAWHVYGKTPTDLLERVRPREDPLIRAYRIQSYEPVTKASCGKALAIVHRIFSATGYSIIFKDTDNAKRLKEYSREKYPRFNDVVNYLANFVMKKMIADPNGVLLVQPFDYYNLKSYEYASPIVTCYASKDIWLYSDEYFLFFDKKETRNKEDHTYFTYVTKNGLYKLDVVQRNNPQTGTKETVVAVEAEFITNFDSFPLWQLGGEYSEQGDGILESYFAAAKPFWNKAICGESDLDGHFIKHMWPQQWAVRDECEYVEENKYPCTGGYIFNPDLTKNQKHKCPQCNGSGYKQADNPYEFHAVDRQKFSGENENISVPGIGYIDVPTEPTAMLDARVEKQLSRALKALNMDIVDEIGLNQSGKAKEMDRAELNQFLQKIADVCFEIHLTNIYYYFVLYMFGVKLKDKPAELEKIEPEIRKPTQFDVYSTAELTEGLAAAKTAKLNPSYLQVKQAEIQNREFQTTPELLDQLNLELSLDPLAEVSTDEVSMMLANGTVTKTSAIIHDNIRMFVRRALEEDKGFAEKKLVEQMAILEGFAEEVEEANKVTIDQSAIAPPGTPGEENIEEEVTDDTGQPSGAD